MAASSRILCSFQAEATLSLAILQFFLCAKRLLTLLMKSHNSYKREWYLFILYVHLELGLTEFITRTMEGCVAKVKMPSVVAGPQLFSFSLSACVFM